jgi:hypothetical protein
MNGMHGNATDPPLLLVSSSHTIAEITDLTHVIGQLVYITSVRTHRVLIHQFDHSLQLHPNFTWNTSALYVTCADNEDPINRSTNSCACCTYIRSQQP